MPPERDAVIKTMEGCRCTQYIKKTALSGNVRSGRGAHREHTYTFSFSFCPHAFPYLFFRERKGKGN